MMRFPITDLLDEQECYDFLLRTLHPDGLKCPGGIYYPVIKLLTIAVELQ